MKINKEIIGGVAAGGLAYAAVAQAPYLMTAGYFTIAYVAGVILFKLGHQVLENNVDDYALRGKICCVSSLLGSAAFIAGGVALGIFGQTSCIFLGIASLAYHVAIVLSHRAEYGWFYRLYEELYQIEPTF